MMNNKELPEKTIRMIAENQKLFIQQFESSLPGKWYLFVWKITGKLSAYRMNPEHYIARINRLKLMRQLKAAEMWGRNLMFHLKYHCPFPRIKHKHQDELVIAAIIKNEGAYLQEWIEFHLLQGVDRFYLFDNGSTDDTAAVLQPYIDSKVVELFSYPGKGAQIFAYSDICRRLRGLAEWVAFIDADEFLFTTGQQTLKEFLNENTAYPGVGVNWVVYGPCGNTVRPKGLVIEHYRETFAQRNHEMNCRVKLIVQPSKVRYFLSPHTVLCSGNQFVVDENGEPIDGTAMYTMNVFATTGTNSIRKIRINHYWTKSLEELAEKCAKGRVASTKNLTVEAVLSRLEGDTITDDAVDRFLPEMRRRMDGRTER